MKEKLKFIRMKHKKFSITKRLQSFKYAFNGLTILLNKEPNARIHLVAALFVMVLSFILQIDKFEWLAVLLCIGLVITAEILNTVVENICDFISPKKHETIKQIKDLSAAAVFVAAIISLIVGGFVFIPKLTI